MRSDAACRAADAERSVASVPVEPIAKGKR